MTVEQILNGIQLILVHVSVRRRTGTTLEYLGGGFSDSVIQRFGKLEVVSSVVQNDVFILYVK